MDLIWRPLTASLIAFAAALLSLFFLKMVARHLAALVACAMGVLFAVTVFDVLPEAKTNLMWPTFGLAAISGYALLWLVGSQIFSVCPACAIGEFDAEAIKGLRSSATLLMIALGIHSLLDGFGIALGDLMRGHPNSGFLFAISVHKVPESLALMFLLLGAGYRPRQALGRTLLIESLTFFAGLGGYAIRSSVSPVWLSILFAHVGGGFLYLVLHTLLGFGREKSGTPLVRLAALGVGCFSLTGFLLRWLGDFPE